MMVMNERIRDLREMASAASNRRASLRRKLELSEEVARRREQAERSAMSAEDGKELLMREFPGSTRPLEPAGHPPGLLQKARTKLGAATFVSRFHQKKSDLLSARFTEKQAERRKKELKAAVLALREAEVNVKVKELEIALAEVGGVDSEVGDVDSEAGDGEVVDLEKEEEKVSGVCCSNNPGEEAAWFSSAAHPGECASACAFECARSAGGGNGASGDQGEARAPHGAAQAGRGQGQGHAGDPQRVAGAPPAAGVAAQACRGPGQGHAGDPQGVSGAPAAAGVAATSGQLCGRVPAWWAWPWQSTSIVWSTGDRKDSGVGFRENAMHALC